MKFLWMAQVYTTSSSRFSWEICVVSRLLSDLQRKLFSPHKKASYSDVHSPAQPWPLALSPPSPRPLPLRRNPVTRKILNFYNVSVPRRRLEKKQPGHLWSTRPSSLGTWQLHLSLQPLPPSKTMNLFFWDVLTSFQKGVSSFSPVLVSCFLCEVKRFLQGWKAL